MKLILLLLLMTVGITTGFSACSDDSAPPFSRDLEVQGDGVILFVKVSGNLESGRVLIALHGGPGLCSHYMAGLHQLANNEFAAATYDQRGVCRSGEPSNGYAMEKYVADLEAVRIALQVDEVHLMGHSWGGLVAMCYAAAHPQNVDTLILMGSGPPDWEATVAGSANKALRIAELQQQGIIPAEITSVSDLLPVYFSDPGFEPPDELINLHYEPTVEQLTFDALGEFDFTEEISTLTHPVLFLWGADDPFGLPMAEATVNALEAADVQFVTIDNCGHFWHERPDAFFSEVRDFLELLTVCTGGSRISF